MTETSLFWLLTGGMTLLVLAFLLAPLLRRPRRVLARAEYDLAIYRDQLRELEEELALGAIEPEAAERARNEIARRILAADDARRKAREQLEAGGGKSVVLASVAAVGMVALAWSLYLQLGQPGRPDMPLKQRLANAARNNDFAALVRRAEQRLQKNPDELRGWLALAPAYEQMGRLDKAVEAWRQVIRLTKDPSAELYNAYAEALVRFSRGRIPDAAVKAFSKALELAPGNPMSRYYLAMADLQAGRREAAYAKLKKLLDDLPPEVPARATIAQQVARLAQALGKKPETAGVAKIRAQAGKPSSTDKTPSAKRMARAGSGPSPDAVRERMKAMRDMSPQQRMEMIRNMVEGLDARLKEDPSDLSGWLRLIRARAVLGERDKAKAALAKARQAFAGKPDALARLDALAGDLDLPR